LSKTFSAALLGMVAVLWPAGPVWALKTLFTDSECTIAQQIAASKTIEQDWKQAIGPLKPADSKATDTEFRAVWAGEFKDGAFGIEGARWDDPAFVADLEGQALFAMACVEVGPKQVISRPEIDGTRLKRHFTSQLLSGGAVKVLYVKTPSSIEIYLVLSRPR
jgi:hypothetical protein